MTRRTIPDDLAALPDTVGATVEVSDPALPGAAGEFSDMTLGELAQYLDRAQRLVHSVSSELQTRIASDEASAGEAGDVADESADEDVYKLVALLSQL